MKLVLIFLIALSDVFAPKVVPFEQIALEYYLKNLTSENFGCSLDLELKRYSESAQWFPKCLGGFQLRQLDVIHSNASGLKRLSIKRPSSIKKKAFPKVYTSTSFSNHEDQQIVNITEDYRFYGNVYHIEMSDTGEVLNACSEGWVKQ